MKKVRVIAVILIFAAIFAHVVFAKDEDDIYTEGTLYYKIANESVTIVGVFGKSAEVSVPASIAGYPVNKIAAGAFVGNKYLKKLYLPDTVTEIEDGAIDDSIQIVYNANIEGQDETTEDIITTAETITDDTTEAYTETTANNAKETAETESDTIIETNDTTESESVQTTTEHDNGDVVMEGDGTILETDIDTAISESGDDTNITSDSSLDTEILSETEKYVTGSSSSGDENGDDDIDVTKTQTSKGLIISLVICAVMLVGGGIVGIIIIKRKNHKF